MSKLLKEIQVDTEFANIPLNVLKNGFRRTFTLGWMNNNVDVTWTVTGHFVSSRHSSLFEKFLKTICNNARRHTHTPSLFTFLYDKVLHLFYFVFFITVTLVDEIHEPHTRPALSRRTFRGCTETHGCSFIWSICSQTLESSDQTPLRSCNSSKATCG